MAFSTVTENWSAAFRDRLPILGRPRPGQERTSQGWVDLACRFTPFPMSGPRAPFFRWNDRGASGRQGRVPEPEAFRHSAPVRRRRRFSRGAGAGRESGSLVLHRFLRCGVGDASDSVRQQRRSRRAVPGDRGCDRRRPEAGVCRPFANGWQSRDGTTPTYRDGLARGGVAGRCHRLHRPLRRDRLEGRLPEAFFFEKLVSSRSP
jgi:hypothetical protein